MFNMLLLQVNFYFFYSCEKWDICFVVLFKFQIYELPYSAENKQVDSLLTTCTLITNFCPQR